jgi:hypothetical protein
VYTEVKPIVALGQADDGPPVTPVGTKQHDVSILMLDHGGIVYGFNRIGHIVFRQDRIALVTPDQGIT